ncbi:MAG: guanylate kinase, partial [Leptolyngbyaceae cyanobacterium SU_3_3]|nr:guanylate kinase [Leptolyngbyaceae cyanobacterium SU_3_3]
LRESIDRRLNRAREEVSAAHEFDIQIVNDDLREALSKIEATLFEPAIC